MSFLSFLFHYPKKNPFFINCDFDDFFLNPFFEFSRYLHEQNFFFFYFSIFLWATLSTCTIFQTIDSRDDFFLIHPFVDDCGDFLWS